MTMVEIDIVCPDWCSIPAEDHARNLWQAGGECHHMPDDTHVQLTIAEGRTFSVGVVKATEPNGRECRPPVFFLNDAEMTLDDMTAVAAEIHRTIAMYQGEMMLG